MSERIKKQPDWWKGAVFYQIYPRSFQDTNGDGIGDLPGIIGHLDYLEKLGIDGIWLSPVFASPQVDNGYDISDYCAIDPMFGTMEDMEKLIREAKKRGISIIMDLVLNHSSDQHIWFSQALQGKDDPFHDYYVWRDGDADTPPNDMCSVFGGSAWTYVPHLKQYYFHQFTPQQPDLNWENESLRNALYEAIRFWVNKGVEGFRLDVIDQIAKEPDRKITANGPRLHEYLRELRQKAFPDPAIVTVGEAWSANPERAKRFSNPDGSELSMVFQFEHMCLDQQGEKWNPTALNLPKLKACLTRWQQELHGQGWNSLFFSNHDLPRIVSRWGDEGVYRRESAKMLATMLHGLEGTPYIYQGEELGMTNIRLPIEEYQDVEIQNFYRERKKAGEPEEKILASIYLRGRDNARTPMQWSRAKNAGFTEGRPWLAVNENYVGINAEDEQKDEDSVFHYYRRLISLRKQLDVVKRGSFILHLPEDPNLFVYERQLAGEHLLVACNFSPETQSFSLPPAYAGARKLIGNYSGICPGSLKPYEAEMLYYQD